MKPKPITIKNLNVLVGLMDNAFHPYLSNLLSFLSEIGDREIVITESYRDPLHPGDLHSTIPVRALDVRSWHYHDPEWISSKINQEFIYDPLRVFLHCCVYHDTGSGKHFHLQVHNRTIRRKDLGGIEDGNRVPPFRVICAKCKKVFYIFRESDFIKSIFVCKKCKGE